MYLLLATWSLELWTCLYIFNASQDLRIASNLNMFTLKRRHKILFRYLSQDPPNMSTLKIFVVSTLRKLAQENRPCLHLFFTLWRLFKSSPTRLLLSEVSHNFKVSKFRGFVTRPSHVSTLSQDLTMSLLYVTYYKVSTLQLLVTWYLNISTRSGLRSLNLFITGVRISPKETYHMISVF